MTTIVGLIALSCLALVAGVVMALRARDRSWSRRWLSSVDEVAKARKAKKRRKAKR